MGAYLSAPVTEKRSSDGASESFAYGTTAMQGWRTNMEVRARSRARWGPRREMGRVDGLARGSREPRAAAGENANDSFIHLFHVRFEIRDSRFEIRTTRACRVGGGVMRAV